MVLQLASPPGRPGLRGNGLGLRGGLGVWVGRAALCSLEHKFLGRLLITLLMTNWWFPGDG